MRFPSWLRQPAYDQNWLGAVVPALAEDLTGEQPPASPGRPTALPHREVRCAVVVLIDGLGSRQLADRAGHAPFLAAQPPTLATCGFPSTTATSLASLTTGKAPGETAMVGYAVRSASTGRAFSLVSWDGPERPEAWQTSPTLFSWVAERGVVAHGIGRSRFAGSGFSRAVLRGAQWTGADTIEQGVSTALDLARAPGRRLIYLYLPDLDKVGHAQGWTSARWAETLGEVDWALGSLARGLPRDTRLVITADHGMIDHDPRSRVDVAEDADLARDVTVVAGEPRAVHLYCAAGTAADVAVRWRRRLDDRAVVLTHDEACGAGLFGPTVGTIAHAAIGDVVVAAAGRTTIVDSRTASMGMLSMQGHHGSLTDDEVEVPLICLD